jgi:hypothetical protein
MNAVRLLRSALLCALTLPLAAHAQSDAKPSAITRARQGLAARQPGPKPDPAAALDALPDRAAFDRLARDFEPRTPQSQPHVLFVVDRGDGNRIHFINTRRFALHAEYLAARRLLPAEGLPASTYRSPTRRFVLGTLSLHPQGQRWVYEFWQGDRLTPELLQLTQAALGRSVGFAQVQLKANAAQQEAVAQEAGLPVITQAELLSERTYLAYNAGTAVGRLRLVGSLDDTADIEPTDIVVLAEVPLALSPVAGVILSEASTALSHVNLLAKGWGVPNIYLRDAQLQLRHLDGQWVRLQADRQHYTLSPATPAEATRARAATARVLKAPHGSAAWKPCAAPGSCRRARHRCPMASASRSASTRVSPHSRPCTPASRRHWLRWTLPRRAASAETCSRHCAPTCSRCRCRRNWPCNGRRAGNSS